MPMGKKKAGGGGDGGGGIPNKEREGYNLLGQPTFEPLPNGRFRCVETGHELPAEARDSYAQSKHCRLGLIDSAIARNKPPLNMFRQDPISRSKLVCKLTGDTINKSEEHIWKHINGKRFLNTLERKEAESQMPNGGVARVGEEKERKKKKKCKEKKKKKKDKEEIISEVRDSAGKDSDCEEADFWMPPVGERWDHDDGGDRWGSGSESEQDANGVVEDEETEEAKQEAGELSKKTKRMSLEIGPSSFDSRKKKKKKTAVA